MAILVTGGTGYIGSHTAVALLQSGRDVVILDNLSNSKYKVVDRIEEIAGRSVTFYKGDLLERGDIYKVFSEHDIEAVIHFAALKAVGESTQKPLLYYHNNVAGSVNLFSVMLQFGVKNIVFSSSATVYGDAKTVPIQETAPLSVTNPYGRTKLMMEDILRDLAASTDGCHIALLRYFNPVGAHKSGLIGEDPDGIPNNLMPYISQVAVGRLPELSIFGDDYPTRDGTGVRDYVHIEDLARGHVLALDYLHNIEGCDAINLGTGRGTSVLEMVAAFEEACGKPIPYAIKPRRAGDVAELYADVEKSKATLGFEARNTVLDMCRDMWHFQQMNPNGYGD